MPRSKAFDEIEVLVKAMDLFWSQGFNATSVQDLVEHLGINRASLYGTYGDKDQLFQRALAHYGNLQLESTRTFLQQQPSGKTAIRELFTLASQQVVNPSKPRGCFVVNVTTERATDADTRQFLVLNETTFTQLFREALTRAMEEGDIAEDRDLDSLATYLFMLYNGINVLSKIHDNPIRLQAAVHEGLRVLD